MNDSIAAAEQVKNTLIDMGLKFGPKLLVAFLIFAVGIGVGRWIGGVADRLLQRLAVDVTVRELLVRLTRLAVLVGVAILALQNLGVELLPLVAGLGIAGAGIALALQGVLSNLAAGLTIVFTRPYQVGEYIAIVGVEGVVERITLFQTTLGHTDRSRVVIPNRKIVGEILHNYGHVRQLEIAARVAYASDVGAALAALRDAVLADRRVLREPTPVIQVVALDDAGVALSARPWVSVPDAVAATGDLHREILGALRARGIAFALPQREVRLLGEAA
jgi:small conductance mechanosensitive channel